MIMCEVTDKIVQKHLDEITEKNRNNKWSGSKYEEVKKATLSDKGKFGEKVTNDYLTYVDYKSEIINGGIGDYDIELNICDFDVILDTLKIEHKLATEDIHNSFQFNGIKKEIDYDYVYCFGVSPNDMWFIIQTREWCEDNLTTNMSKNVTGGYKYTVPVKRMLPLTKENFIREIDKIVK